MNAECVSFGNAFEPAPLFGNPLFGNVRSSVAANACREVAAWLVVEASEVSAVSEKAQKHEALIGPIGL